MRVPFDLFASSEENAALNVRQFFYDEGPTAIPFDRECDLVHAHLMGLNQPLRTRTAEVAYLGG